MLFSSVAKGTVAQRYAARCPLAAGARRSCGTGVVVLTGSARGDAFFGLNVFELVFTAVRGAFLGELIGVEPGTAR